MNVIGKKTLEIMSEAKWYNKWLFSLMEPYIKGEILEIGAGVGTFTDFLAQKGKVTAIDVNGDYVNNLKKKIASGISSGFGNVETNNYFFKGKKFDAIVCINVLEHIRNEKRALINMQSLLKPNGYLVLLVPAHQILYSNFDKEIGHYRRYSESGVRKLLEDFSFSSKGRPAFGWKIYDLRYINWWAAIGWFLFIKILRIKNMPKNPVGIFDKLGKLFLLPERIFNLPFGLSILAIAQKQ